jgi:tight adherence protein B
MTFSMPILVSVLAGLAILLVFMALWVLLQERDPVEERLEEYAGVGDFGAAAYAVGDVTRRYYDSKLMRFLAGFGLGPKLALLLTRANVPMTATEFTLIVVGLAVLGFVAGTLRLSPWLGLAMAAIMAVLPVVIVRVRWRRRLRAFTEQLPDMLTLLVGSLRAGYGLSQSIEVLVDRMPPPSSEEMENVMRAVNLGLPIQRALTDAVERIGSDDFNLVVVAINVQYETGGNLAETLEIIAETVRDRLRILSEIRVMTTQQRFTGYVLGFLPMAVAVFLFFVNPGYITRLLEPGWVRILPIGALVMQVLGFLVIRQIVDIEV